MADGLTTTTTVATIPNATKIATDDAGAAGHVQMVKLAIATDGSATALTADNTDGLLVNLGTNNDVTVTSGSVTATQGTATNLKAEVIGTGTFAVQATLAAGAATIAKAEDAASNDLDVGVPALAVRKATPANTSGTDGDYEFLQMSAGRLWTSATVDAALPAGANAIGKLAANSGVDIGDVDVTSVTPGTTASSLGKAEDAGHTTGDVGVMALAVRLDTGAAIAGTDGDYSPLQVDASGALRVTGGGGGTEYTEDAVAPADPVGTTLVMTRDDQLSAVSEAEGDWSRARSTAKGALWVAIPDTNGDPITSFGGGTQYTEDAASPADPVGTALVMVRDDQLSTVTEVEGDWSTAKGTSKGALWVAIPDANGDPITSFGGGTQYTEADTDATITGTAILWEDSADTLRAVSASKPLPVGDAGGSLTVDGTVSVSGAVDTELPTAAALADNTSTPTAPAVGAFGMVYDGSTWDFARGTAADGALVNLGGNNDVTVTSISAGTNYIGKVRLTDGTLDSSLVDETGASAVDAVAVGGGTPHDSVDSGNPIKMGMKAANALPTAVANNDRANALGDLWGRQLVSHIDPAMQVWKSANYTATQTGAVIWDPTSGKKIAITYIAIGTYGTTAARLILWLGDNADATYSAGTDQLVFAGSYAPSSTSKPGTVLQFPTPLFCTTADRELHITTDAGMSVDITVYGYEW